MYQIGQCIVYRNVGVCRVEAIGKLGQLDTNYKNQILHLLVDEFSYALNETPEAARKRLYEAVSVLV